MWSWLHRNRRCEVVMTMSFLLYVARCIAGWRQKRKRLCFFPRGNPPIRHLLDQKISVCTSSLLVYESRTLKCTCRWTEVRCSLFIFFFISLYLKVQLKEKKEKRPPSFGGTWSHRSASTEEQKKITCQENSPKSLAPSSVG